MPTIRAMRLLNAIKAGTTTGAQLQTLLTADPGRLAEFNVLLGMRGQMRRMAASSTAMTAVAASSTAMAAVIASSTAMAAVIASSTAMTAVNANDQAVRIWMLAGTNQVWSNFASVTAVAASSTAMTAVAASSTAMAAVIASSTAMAAVIASSTAMTAVNANDQAVRIWMLAGTNQVWSNFASVTAVAASSTAMTAVAASKTALLACWNAETALTALRASPSALTALIASPFKSTVGGSNPSALTAAMLTGKTILLQSRNSSGTDTNTLATKYQNGGAVANHVYTTTNINSAQMVAFQDIKHTTYQNNYVWSGNVVKVD